jgi:RHS repeat-associated protein
VLERFAYDPFGARRHPDTGERLQGGALAELLDRQDTSGSQGFTDHRHLDRTGFIHMQGRVFDPRAGRFLSPDPLLQNPADAQSFNRYAYVGYDALSLVDPSGMCGREVGYQLTPCEAGLEQLRVVASRLPGAGLPFAFGSLSYAGAAPWMSLPGGLPTVGGLGLPNLSGIVPQVLTQLNAAGLRSAGAAVCLGSVLGGCGALSVDTRSGAVYGMLLLGVVPGAGLSIGAERVLWQSPTQQAGGFGTALFVSGGVAGLGGSLALAQGTNGVNLTGTVGYGFGFGGGAGFYYALPLGVLGY